MDRRRGLTVGAPASCHSTHPPSRYVCKRKDRAAFAGGPSLGRKRLRGGGATWGCRRLYLAFRKTPSSTGTGIAEASRNGKWQPRYDFASQRTGHRARSLPAFASGESGNFRFEAVTTRRAKRPGRWRRPLLVMGPVALVIGALGLYLATGRYVSEEDAYMQP